MKYIRFPLCLLLAALCLVPVFAGGGRESVTAAAGKGLKDFSAVEVSAGISVAIKQAAAFSVRATGDQATLDRLQMTVRGEALRIGFKPGTWGVGSVHVDIAMPTLGAIQLSGGSRATIDMDATKPGNFAMDLSGGSRLEGTLLAGDLTINLSGGSRVAIGGYAMGISGELNGGSRFDCLDFAVDKAALQLSGGSAAALAVQTLIAVDASGGSRLEYRGSPQVVQNLSGAASVEKSK